MKNILFIVALFSFSHTWAEDRAKHIDSLKNILLTSRQDTARVNLLNQLSEDYIAMDMYDSSISYASKASVLAKRLRFDIGYSMSLRKIGISYSTQGDYPKALSYLFRALKISESIKNNYEIAMAYNSIGVIRSRQGDFDDALNYLYKSLSFYKNPLVYADIAKTYHMQNKDMLAIEFYRKALSFQIHQIEKSYILNDLGDIYERRNNIDSALVYYFKSLEISKITRDDMGICDATGSIGDLFLRQKKYDAAIEYENKSLDIARKINYKYCIKETEKSLSEIYENIGNNAMSLLHYKNYISVRDTMFSEENTRQTIQTEMNFKFEKQQDAQRAEQDKKDALAKSELKRQQAQRNAVIVGLCIVIVFSIFIFRGYKQKQKANKELANKNNVIEEQKKIVENSHKELTDNITYAKNLQRSMLPSEDYMKKNMPENELVFFPRDIVSGDFYWCFKDGDDIYFAVADATGHGAAASLLTVMAISLLNEIVIHRKIRKPEMVLNVLRDEMIKSLNQDGASEERKDGLDISFVKISGMKLECACANNPIYIVRDGNLIEVKSNRFPIGKYLGEEKPFTLNTMELKKDDVIYALSDGFVDQFSEKTGKKLMSKRFKEWICELSDKKINHIKSELENRFKDWKGSEHQTDDVTVLIVKI